MVVDCDNSLFRKFDSLQQYLWEWIPSRGKSRGILVGIKTSRFDVGSFKKGDYILQMNLWDKEIRMKWNLMIVYGAVQEEHKIYFLTELSRFCDVSSEPYLVGDDFNIIRYIKEKSSNRRSTNILECSTPSFIFSS